MNFPASPNPSRPSSDDHDLQRDLTVTPLDTRNDAPAATSTSTVDKSAARVRSMFAAIAGRYDLLNHLLSLNIDQSWRDRAARRLYDRLADGPSGPILDCCTGTCDLALTFDRVARGQRPIVGIDFTPELLRLGAVKLKRRGRTERITLGQGDALRLPFASNTFAASMVAFGLRNVADTQGGIDELTRVVQPGGVVAILEFSRPRGPVLGRAYLSFFRDILPRIGQTIAPNTHNAYGYLPQSVLEFPDGPDMIALLERRGLTDVTAHPLTVGIATLYLGVKPR